MDMIDESIDALRSKVQHVISLVEKLKNENIALKEKIKSLEEQLKEMTDQIAVLRSEREEIKGKIDSAIAMFDELKIGDINDE